MSLGPSTGPIVLLKLQKLGLQRREESQHLSPQMTRKLISPSHVELIHEEKS